MIELPELPVGASDVWDVWLISVGESRFNLRLAIDGPKKFIHSVGVHVQTTLTHDLDVALPKTEALAMRKVILDHCRLAGALLK